MPGAANPLTFEEFIRLPEGEPGKDELLDGEWIHAPLPEQNHNDSATALFFGLTNLIGEITRAGGAHRAGKVHIAAGYRIGRDSFLGPDVSVTHANQPRGRHYEGAPLIAIEIISGSNSAPKVGQKIEKYLQNGSQEVWVA